MASMEDNLTFIYIFSDVLAELLKRPEVIAPYFALMALIAFQSGFFFWLGYHFFPDLGAVLTDLFRLACRLCERWNNRRKK